MYNICKIEIYNKDNKGKIETYSKYEIAVIIKINKDL